MLTLFRPVIRSRHPSHSILRRKKSKILPLLPFKSLVRFGSTTDIKDTVTNGGKRLEINTIQAVKNSSSKLLMKTCFREGNVKTADWWSYVDGILRGPDGRKNYKLEDLPYPLIVKKHFGSRNQGNTKIDTLEQMYAFEKGKDLQGYIFEKFYNYTREYRLHVTAQGCFYTCRKMLKEDTPEKDKWFRNDAHCVWIMEENPLFDKPVNWNKIVKESVKALKSVGLDIGAVDLKIRASKGENDKVRKDPDFIVIEINSAPSFGEVTKEKYVTEIPKILNLKFKGNE